jgi:hypothetical protein
MMVAATEPCDDFPEPKEPASLSGYKGSAASSSSDYDSGDDSEDAATTTPSTDADGDGFDDATYAPGAGQSPSNQGRNPPGRGGGRGDD